MLKKIPVSSLRMGMHLHKLEGSWMHHPFWKTRFVIQDPQDLKDLKACGLAECWIDTDLGLDDAQPTAWTAPEVPATPPEPPLRLGPSLPALPPRGAEKSMHSEMREAAAICGRGKEAVTALFNEARMGRSVDAEQCLPLVEEITHSVARSPGAMVSLARLKTKDDYSYMHSVAVCALMVALGRQLGLGDDECREAGLAGLLHDIGKALLPLEILNKPGHLTDAEFAQVRKHPEHGYQLLVQGGECQAGALDVALHHHERFDGKGYPHGLAGDQISRLARMGAVCDVYDAITSDRPYKVAWDPAESVARMAGWNGHFDGSIFSAMVQSLGIYPVGSLVRLESEQLAVVVAQNPGSLINPVVKVFFSLKRELPVAPQVVDLGAPGCQDRIVGREQRRPGEFPWLNDLWLDPDTARRVAA